MSAWGALGSQRALQRHHLGLAARKWVLGLSPVYGEDAEAIGRGMDLV